MNVYISKGDDNFYGVSVDRVGMIGMIGRRGAEPFKFTYSEAWVRMTYDENTAVLAAVEPKVTLLNITRRLTK